MFADYDTTASEAWVEVMGTAKVNSNCAAWKCNTLKNMRVYVQRVLDADPGGLIEDVHSHERLVSIFGKKFELSDFLEVFYWLDDYLDLDRSTKKARWWVKCKLLML